MTKQEQMDALKHKILILDIHLDVDLKKLRNRFETADRMSNLGDTVELIISHAKNREAKLYLQEQLKELEICIKAH